jgi:oxalate decarboxylase/phosphoglucose isomerase-like protein (cupin superfamily)
MRWRSKNQGWVREAQNTGSIRGGVSRLDGYRGGIEAFRAGWFAGATLWHANPAEWAYVISGFCCTTVLHQGRDSATDDFGPGDVWHFLRGYGHSIQGLGPGECHFTLSFDNGYFSGDRTFSVSARVAHAPGTVVARGSWG